MADPIPPNFKLDFSFLGPFETIAAKAVDGWVAGRETMSQKNRDGWDELILEGFKDLRNMAIDLGWPGKKL